MLEFLGKHFRIDIFLFNCANDYSNYLQLKSSLELRYNTEEAHLAACNLAQITMCNLIMNSGGCEQVSFFHAIYLFWSWRWHIISQATTTYDK